MSDNYPETLAFRVPAGYRRRLTALAAADDRNLADFLRETCRRLLQAADKREQRRRQARSA